MANYKGKFKPKNFTKYRGDPTLIIYRSLWELSVMKWCDSNCKVILWNSEEVVVPYRCQIDNKLHRYYIDFYIKFNNGDEYWIEVKPDSQTKAPKKGKRKTKKYINEVLTYGKNMSKWKAAKIAAESNGIIFQIWTENTLNKLGISIISPIRKKIKK